MDSTNKNQSFFTKKKIISYSFVVIIFAIFIFLISKFILNINFNQILTQINTSYSTNNLFFLWLFLLFGFLVYNVALKILVYWVKLKRMHIHVEWYNWLIFSFITFFIANITPFAVGSEPYVIYWLKKRGLSLKEATAIVASCSVIIPLVQVIITWPSFFYISSTYGVNRQNSEWVWTFWLVFMGLMFDLLNALFWILISVSKRIHFWIACTINFFKRIFKLKHKTKDETREEYIENASFKEVFISVIKDTNFLILTILGGLIWNLYYYLSLYFSFEFLYPNIHFDWFDIFNYANVGITANNFIPVPGGEGTIQIVISTFIQFNQKYANISNVKDLVNNSIFIWRWFGYYLLTIIGTLFFFILVGQESYKFIIKNKKKSVKIPNKSFTIVLFDNNDELSLNKTMKSLLRNDYNKNLIDIIVVSKNKITIKYDDIENRVFEYESKYKNYSQMLFALYNENIIKNDYVWIIDSKSFVSYDILNHINSIYNTYDIYSCCFKKIKNNKEKWLKKTGFHYIYKKQINNKQQMCSKNIKLSNMCFKKELLINSINFFDYDKESDEVYLINKLINNANNLRYVKKISGCFDHCDNNKFNSNNNNSQIIDECINNNLQELAFYKFKDQIKQSNIKKNVKRKFDFKNYPFYFRWFIQISFLIRYKKYFYT